MNKLNVVELCCGSATFSDVFETAGHNTFRVDVRRRKGVCEPDLRKDVLELGTSDIPFERVDVLWISPPCDVFSYAAGSFHWNKDGTPKTEKCKLHIRILKKCLELVEQLSPGYFFIENPRGKMRHQKCMLDFLSLTNGSIKLLTLGSYGFETTKPTNLFTNANDFVPRPLVPFGRGAKVPGIFSNLTKCQRQKTPVALAKDILAYVEKNTSR